MNKVLTQGVGLFLAAFLLVAGANIIQAQTFTGSGFTIQDGAGAVAASCGTVTVSGITGNVNLTGVGYGNVTHTWIGDLVFGLYRPSAAPPPSTTGFVDLSSPPDGTSCNFNAANINLTDTGAQTIDAAVSGCTTNQVIPGGNYLGSNYGGGVANGTPKSVLYSFGQLTPAQANGNWLVCTFDLVTDDGGSVGSTSLTFTPSTAAGATVSGKVVSGINRSVANAVVTLTDAQGITRTARTNSFGFFSFSDVPTAQVYVIGVTAKQFKFIPQAINLNENLSDLIFIGQ